MEENIIISNLNDFIFCPRSIYFHNLYSSFDEHMYHSTYQAKGKNAHKQIDSNNYSTKRSSLEGIDIYNEELGVIGKIDIFDIATGTLTERKRLIKTIYEGYYLQIYAQYFCLKEMGYEVRALKLYSLSDNKSYPIDIPKEEDKKRLIEVIGQMKQFRLEDPGFTQNPEKCKMCIYKQLCDYYQNDE